MRGGGYAVRGAMRGMARTKLRHELLLLPIHELLLLLIHELLLLPIIELLLLLIHEPATAGQTGAV